MDADAQHDPAQIPDFLAALKEADVVLGYRKLDKNMPAILKFGNYFINKITRLLYGIDLKDTQCGYRAFKAAAYKKIRWQSSNYSMESEMIANIGKRQVSYKEIPIKTIYRDRYKGTTVFDGIKVVWNLFWWRLSR
jgi:dolichol-phosphate mannosyltransferase